MNLKGMERHRLVDLARAYYKLKEHCKANDYINEYKHYLKCFMEVTASFDNGEC